MARRAARRRGKGYNSPRAMIAFQPVTPVIVKVVPPPTAQVSIVDILVGSFGIIGLLVVGSALLGLAVGGLLSGYSRWKIAHGDPAPGGENTRLDLSSPPR